MTELPKLALDDPRWHQLTTDGYPIEKILAGLARLAQGGPFQTPDSDRGGFDFTAGTLHQGSVYSSTLAVFPYVVEAAARLTHSAVTAEAWTWLGIIASAYREAREGGFGKMPEYLLEGYRAARVVAERCAVECFTALALPDTDTVHLAFAALALGDHGAGRFLWSMPEPPGKKFAMFATATCPRCEAEIEFLSLDDGVAELKDAHPPTSADPKQPPLTAPAFDANTLSARTDGVWAPIAVLLRDGPASPLLPTEFDRTAAQVAALGVPLETPERAALCLPAALVARRGHDVWVSPLARLASEMHCPECQEVTPFVDWGLRS